MSAIPTVLTLRMMVGGDFKPTEEQTKFLSDNSITAEELQAFVTASGGSMTFGNALTQIRTKRERDAKKKADDEAAAKLPPANIHPAEKAGLGDTVNPAPKT